MRDAEADRQHGSMDPAPTQDTGDLGSSTLPLTLHESLHPFPFPAYLVRLKALLRIPVSYEDLYSTLHTQLGFLHITVRLIIQKQSLAEEGGQVTKGQGFR